MDAHTSTLLKQTEVLGGYDPSRYVSERLWATAADGVRVPISLVSRVDAPGAVRCSGRKYHWAGVGGSGFLWAFGGPVWVGLGSFLRSRSWRVMGSQGS